MIIILGSIRLEDAAECERVRHALAARAARSRQDAGNLAYAFAVNVEDPTEIQLVERWEDEASLHAHLAIPDPEFNTLLATARIRSATVTAYTGSDARVLMSR
ncbi:MAG: putative quinol monooxygenase [Gammaproteobacteria bacterium]